MTLTRIFLKLEVKNDSKILDISYTAPDLHEENFELIKSKKSRKLITNKKQTFLSNKEAQLYLGQRKYQSFTIRTFFNDMASKIEKSDKILKEDATKITEQEKDPNNKDQKDSKMDLQTLNTCIDPPHEQKKESRVSFKSALMAGLEEKPPCNKDDNIEFFSGNPAVESTEGVLHLYKENEGDGNIFPGSDMLCMVCIPATLCLQDLLVFLKPISQDLELIRIVRPSTPNEYMALLKFRDIETAREFYKTYNLKCFNSIEADVCHLVYVARVDCTKSQEGAGKPLSNAVELPVCAVCLEKMDESIEGILTILCNHSFHAPCMAKCEDVICPVCRYIQTPVAVAENKCFQCSIHEDLWICLICGEVGCGRYTNGHAYKHFKDTAHTFAMQLGSSRVWDYVGENYVHRLVMNKMDGKVVEIDQGRSMDAMVRQDEKFESLSLEYTYLLTNQLESQREYFENKMSIMKAAKEDELEELTRRMQEVLQSREENRDKQVLEKRCALLDGKLNKVQNLLEEEKQMNSCLRQNQQEWQLKVQKLEEKLNAKENESTELREQLRDVMFFLEAQNKLTTADVSAEELQQSHVVVEGAKTRKGRRKK